MGLALEKKYLQKELFSDPREARILPFNGRAFFTLNRIENGRMMQKPYNLDQLEYVLTHISNDRDTYMSQGFFSKPCRRVLFIETMTHAYVDLDIYKGASCLEPWMTKQQIAQAILCFCDDNQIPVPSAIISSGRGIYLKWYWSNPIPRAAAGRAVAVNRQLVSMFGEWGADPACVDMSRILRVVGTVNTKNNQPVELLHQTEADGKVLTYDFEMFADEVLPFTMEQIRGFRQAQKEKYETRGEVILLAQERARERLKAGNRKAFNKYDWCWGVVEDIRIIAEKKYGGVIPYCEESGHVAGPDMYAHIGASMLGHVIASSQLRYEIKTWASLILPASYVNDKSSGLMAHSSSLLRLAKRGESYRYRTQTIIDKLGITSDDMQKLGLKVLIDKDEKRRRDRESWRASHTGQTRQEYEANSLSRVKPWEEMGVSRRTYYRRKSSI